MAGDHDTQALAPVLAMLPPPSAGAEPFWQGCDARELRLPRCDDCDRFSYPPRMLCPHCGSRSLHFEAADREGRVHSFVHVGFSPFGDFWKDDVPYTVVRVDLDCGVRFMARLVGHDRDAIEIDDQVVMGFAPVRDSDRRVPVFMRVNQTAGISDDE